MKDELKRALLVACHCLVLLMKPLGAYVARTRILVLPSADPGSLGDEAMCLALLTRGLAEENQIDVFYFSDRDSWNDLFRRHHLERLRLIKVPTSKSIVFFLPRLFIYKRAYCIGADVMDGRYGAAEQLITCSILRALAVIGARVRVLGCSFSRDPEPSCVDALKALPPAVEICARDHLSQERLQTALHRPVELVADMAFLVQREVREESVKSLLKWIREQRDMGTRIVGVNANSNLVPHANRHSLQELARIYHEFVEEVVTLAPAWRVVFLGHDMRGRDEFSFARIIHDMLPPHLESFCQRQAERCSFREMRAICASLDLVVTGRMHLAIASLGEGTPVGCIVYNDKFEGLIQGHFHLENVLMRPEEAFARGGLSRFLVQLGGRLPELRSRIGDGLPHVMDLAKSNFREFR